MGITVEGKSAEAEQLAAAMRSQVQAMRALGSPASTVTRVKSFSSGGTGTTRIDTTSVVPESGTTTMKTAMTVEVAQGGGPAEESVVETRTSVQLSRP